MREDWRLEGRGAGRPLLILAHGAGAGMDTPFMNFMAEALAGEGIETARFEYAYMRDRRANGGRRPPPRADRLLAEHAARVREWAHRAPVFIGGKSMGGRIASMLADDLRAEGLAAGLICLGYPFHPPGRPEKTRTAHLERLKTPALICQGTRDPFGSREEVSAYRLSPAIGLHWAEDGNHDLKPRVKSGRTWEENMRGAARAAAAFMRRNRRG